MLWWTWQPEPSAVGRSKSKLLDGVKSDSPESWGGILFLFKPRETLFYIYILYIIYICCIYDILLFLLSNPWTESLWTSKNEAGIKADVTQDRSIRCQCRPDLPAVFHEQWLHAALTTLKLDMKDVAWAEVKKSLFALERSCRAEDHSIITTWWPDSRKWSYGDSHIPSDLP